MNYSAKDIEQAVINLHQYYILELSEKSNNILLSVLISIIAVIVSILIAIYSIAHKNNIRLTDAFNKIYRRTFAFRAKISKITQEFIHVDFYYELDSICSITLIEEEVLDYLTEMENFFALIHRHNLAEVSFKKLVSLAFYQRVAALYPYILFKREATKNNQMFTNYVKVLKMMKGIKKIKMQFQNNTPICYVGIRESDIFYSSNIFKNCVSIFSSNPEKEPFGIRVNQNINHKEILPYQTSQLRALEKQNPNYKFHFYNQLSAYNFPPEILEKSLYINQKDLLKFLNNKLTLKKWFVDCKIPVVPYETFLGKDIIYSRLANRFENYKDFVVQSCHGGGGIGTFLADYAHFSEVSTKLNDFQQYIVSPYLPSVSTNTHIFVGSKQTVISPGSIQIVETHDNQLSYRGGDFVAFRALSDNVKKEIKRLSLQISDLLRSKGYRGIAGIDFIITDNQEIFCCEINPRFQASSLLIDCYLKAKDTCSSEAVSCFELNKMAFENCMISTLCFEDVIDLSCYYYYSDGHSNDYYQEKYKLLKDLKLDVFDDGMDFYLKNNSINSSSYLFRIVFPHAICKISPDTSLWINDNIPVQAKPKNGLTLKVALLNQGVRIDSTISNIKNGAYESVDIKIERGNYFSYPVHINCACGIHLSEYSPYFIKSINKKEILYYYNNTIEEIEIEIDLLEELSQINRKILFLATDRLRIKSVAGCENKNLGKGCHFCNVPVSESVFSISEIEEALSYLEKQNVWFRHILLGGGSYLGSDSWDKLIFICSILKNSSFYKDKPISIMTILPPKEKLALLKAAGVEEVAFNLEITNDTLASKLIPGKRSLVKDAYYEIFKESVKIFGIGNVRSALLVGLDKEQDLYNEIHTLAAIGVIPCLSAFRALPNSNFANQLGPDNEYLIKVYEKSSKMLESLSGEIHKLGPNCVACQNNMLVL